MSRCPTFTFQVSKVPKQTTANHISTKFLSKLFFGTDIFTFDISLRWIWKNISRCYFWNDDGTKMKVLLATRLNSPNPHETEIHNEFWHINLYENTGISNWHICVSTLRKCGFCLYFSSIHDYCLPKTRNCLLHSSWSEIERCEKSAFQLLKMRKMNFSWN